MTDQKRKPLSKKIRFEVFKRDGFRCVYCGKTSNESKLHVDHINPVSKGGSNAISNLATACEDCNFGKKDIRLDSIPESLYSNINHITEQAQKLKEYRTALKELDDLISEDIDAVQKIFNKTHPNIPFENDFKADSLRNFITELGIARVKKAMWIACGNDFVAERTIRYFCGICLKRIRDIPIWSIKNF